MLRAFRLRSTAVKIPATFLEGRSEGDERICELVSSYHSQGISPKEGFTIWTAASSRRTPITNLSAWVFEPKTPEDRKLDAFTLPIRACI
jgi:hypothetical protein